MPPLRALVGYKANTPQTSTQQVDYSLLKRIDGETRKKIIPRIIAYREPSEEVIKKISEQLGVDSHMVETLMNYLITDPDSREEIREMGYSNSYLPGWVIIIPGDKFATSIHSGKTE